MSLTPQQLAHLRELLWPPGLSSRVNVWVILDGARDDRIYGRVDGCHLERTCLYSGDLPWQLQMTAPYLVQLDPEDQFTDYLLRTGWGQSWGIFFRSESGMPSIRKHLRRFLVVQDESGKRLIFRYYDPRVLRVYLPTCWPAELRTIFGTIDCFLMEAEDPSTLLRFRLRGESLQQERFSLDQAPVRETARARVATEEDES